MKIKEGFVLHHIMGKPMVVAVGEASRDFHGIIKLNDSASDLWEWLIEGAEQDELVRRLCEQYDVEEQTAADDVARFIDKLRAEGILEE